MIGNIDLRQYLQEKAAQVEKGFKTYLTDEDVPEPLRESVRYSLFAGGKRLRPVLLLATMEALNGNSDSGLPAACAVEMIHTYSLIHDDLPAMDDDDYRRGKPSNHKVFGDAMAILAGDALLTHAFETISHLVDTGHDADKVVRLTRELAHFAGIRGMVGGQAADLLGENQQLTLEELQYIHQHKTADMIVFCVRAGAILADASPSQINALTRYGRHIGLAFQIQDDILDVIGDEQKLGKAVGSDEAKNKSTYPALIGLDSSRQKLNDMIKDAKQALAEAGVEKTVLAQIADFVISRDQ
ncbi:MAG: polyprenyl synthetase family protein [Bacillaceae bacterium]|nr:polyprenyl synthetase family protein [Bacillaceae bacterium]